MRAPKKHFEDKSFMICDSEHTCANLCFFYRIIESSFLFSRAVVIVVVVVVGVIVIVVYLPLYSLIIAGGCVVMCIDGDGGVSHMIIYTINNA